jgi:hypothetical protein
MRELRVLIAIIVIVVFKMEMKRGLIVVVDVFLAKINI